MSTKKELEMQVRHLSQPQKLEGKVFIKGKEVVQATAFEVAPANNAIYMITVRSQLTTPVQFDLEEWIAGKVDVRYVNALLAKSPEYECNFLDYGLEDMDGRLIISLFFKGMTKPSVPSMIIQQPKHSMAALG